ncbi:hypothetical protein ZWY2020_014559 [Hordeum vulgare]|nr:hypothetical protein ZWY2020_014559 [Hordeum vulgare]
MPPQLLRLPAGSSGIFSSDAEYPRDAAGPLVERRLRAPAPGVESMATVRSQVRRCLILTEYTSARERGEGVKKQGRKRNALTTSNSER